MVILLAPILTFRKALFLRHYFLAVSSNGNTGKKSNVNCERTLRKTFWKSKTRRHVFGSDLNSSF